MLALAVVAAGGTPACPMLDWPDNVGELAIGIALPLGVLSKRIEPPQTGHGPLIASDGISVWQVAHRIVSAGVSLDSTAPGTSSWLQTEQRTLPSGKLLWHDGQRLTARCNWVPCAVEPNWKRPYSVKLQSILERSKIKYKHYIQGQ